MRVILNQDIKSLGKKGKVCEVSDGYARNYLLPKGLAVEATTGNIQDLSHKQKQEEKRKQKEKEDAEILKNRIESLKIVLKVKAGEKGRLFGSVTNKEVAEVLLKDYDIKIDKRKIEVKEPIKAEGVYALPVKLHPEVTAALKVHVQAME